VLGRQERWQDDLFVAGPLSSLIPDDHILKRVDKHLDLSWLREEVKDLYCSENGRPGIDPEAAVRLMIAGYFQGIVHDRKLMREAQVNLAIRWFAGFALHEKLPNHSTLTRIRQRWGEERFKKIFLKTIQSCIDAGLVSGETVHVDATLIRADVSWNSLAVQHADKVVNENAANDGPQDEGPETARKKPKKISTTDPDATMATSSAQRRLEPSYKQHTAVDDRCGVIVDVAVTTGEVSEGTQLLEQIERVEANTGMEIKTVTADAGYAHGRNYEQLEKKDIDAIIPAKGENNRPSHIPARRFKYDGKNDIVRCPRGRILRRCTEVPAGVLYRARAADCRKCPLQRRCMKTIARSAARTIVITPGHEALLRARRRRHKDDEKFRKAYARHQHKSEGMHGEAKVLHGLRRAVRRGLSNVAIQAYLTAAVINLKRLAAFARIFLHTMQSILARFAHPAAADGPVLARSEQFAEINTRTRSARAA
jgi:transposase